MLELECFPGRWFFDSVSDGGPRKVDRYAEEEYEVKRNLLQKTVIRYIKFNYLSFQFKMV